MSLQQIVTAAAVAALAAGPAHADSYRLAFSKAENIEIFVEHPAGSSWCSAQLALRVVHGGAPDQAALAGLLPRLGALLDRNCPQAQQLTWASTTSDGRPVAQGTSAKADGWALVTTVPAQPGAVAVAPPPAPASAAPTAAPPATPTTPQVASESPATPVAPTPAPAPVLAAAPPAAPSPPAAPPPLAAPSPPTTPAPQAATAPPPAPAPPAVTAPTPAPAAAPEPAAQTTEPTPPVTSPPPLAAFTVNGWKPLEPAQARAEAGFLTTLQDQNGCRIVSHFNLGPDAQYLVLKSQGLACGADGYAQGSGRLMLERSDGAVIARSGTLWFAGGLPFNQEVAAARLAATDGRQTLWFHLASDTSTRIHYLMRARLGQQGGIGVWMVDPQIDGLTEDENRFRQADSIREAVTAGLAALEHAAMPNATQARLVFSSDFAKGTVAGQADHLIYSITASRRINHRTRMPQGDWQFNLQHATNHLFQRDQRRAQEQRMQEQRAERERQLAEQREQQRLRMERIQQANVERRHLQTYRALVAEAERDPAVLLTRLESDIRYEPGTGGEYARLLAGGQRQISRIVRVSGRDGEDAEVDWPYEMRLVGQRDLKKAWYRVNGALSLDPKRYDGEDLPLTLLTPAAGGVVACKKDGCADLTDPLEVFRLTANQPEWTPAAAEAVIERAQ